MEEFKNGKYYLYGTPGKYAWHGADGFYCYISDDLENWEGPQKVFAPDETFCSDRNYWAPEVHKYNGAYYMFTTYRSSVTGHRGCTIMKSDSPEGPFVPISKNSNGEPGHPTPDDLYTIDATLYVDREGQPWMVYSKEWMTVDAEKG